MRFTIASDLPPARGLPGRLRLRSLSRLTEARAGGIEEALLAIPCISHVSASYLTGSVVVCYEAGCREAALAAMHALKPVNAVGERAKNMSLDFRLRIIWKLLAFAGRRLLLPPWIRVPVALWQSLHYVKAAAAELINEGKVGVSVLDEAATSIWPRLLCYCWGWVRCWRITPRRWRAGNLPAASS